ncbi:MAG: ribonuclease T [Gemmatimonadaceae bacterium]
MTKLIRYMVAVALFASLPAIRVASAQTRAASAGSPFDYYLLTLSWAPDFCGSGAGFKDPNECGVGRHVGFIVHGLWPQSNQGRGPENCGGPSRVPTSVINPTLSVIPSAGLIQHEWKAHGTCTGMSAQDYFALLRNARAAITIPANFASMTQTVTANPADVAKQFSAANPALLPASVRVTCRGGALEEVRMCLDKNLRPRGCTNSAGGCNSSKIRILPTR